MSDGGSRAYTWFFAALVGLAVCVFVCLLLTGGGSAPATHSPLDAWVVTERFVEAQLVAPATAEFPCCCDDFTVHLGDGRYRVAAYVDSENRMGALVRTEFVAEVQWLEGDRYELVQLALEEW